MSRVLKYQDTLLGLHVKGHRLFELCVKAADCRMGVKLGGTPISYDDTTATYSLSTDVKLNKAKRAELLAFLYGVMECYRLM